jgi:hypothetical protein
VIISLKKISQKTTVTVRAHKSEAQEQADLIEWAESCVRLKIHPELKLLHAIPNGGSRDIREAKNLKRQGVKAGVPDLCLPVPKGAYHGLYIEMKVGRNKPSAKQKEWLAALAANGYAACVCYGAAEARRYIEKYLRSEAKQ